MSNTDGICRIIKDPYIQHQCELPPESLAERKKEEPGEMGALAKDIVTGTAKESRTEKRVASGATKFLGEHVGTIVEKVAPFAHAFTGSIHAVEISALIGEQGKKRGQAVSRENHDLAMNFVAFEAKPDALPKGYLQARRESLMGENGKIGDSRHSPHVVNTQIDHLEKGLEANEPGMVAYRDAWVSGLEKGQREAHVANVTDESSLASARKKESFDNAYQSDPAFREGVRAAMWQAKHHPEDFAADKAKLQAMNDQLTQLPVRVSA